jgi:hypothetical protein
MLLLVELRRRGVVLALVGDRLRVRARRGVLTAADRDRLRAERDGVTALVREERDRPAGLLPIVRHDHECRCGLVFNCAVPACAGNDITCVCCKLDAMADRAGVAAKG